MGRQAQHGAPVCSDLAGPVDGAELAQEFARLVQVGRRGCGKPVQLAGVLYAPAGQFQHGLGQVCVQYLRSDPAFQSLLAGLAPGAVAMTRSKAPRASRTLQGRCMGDETGLEAGEAGGRVEAGFAVEAGVDNHCYALDGQAGLGDVGGENHAPPVAAAADDGVLLCRWYLAMQWLDEDIWIRLIAQQVVQAADLVFAGQERQYMSGPV